MLIFAENTFSAVFNALFTSLDTLTLSCHLTVNPANMIRLRPKEFIQEQQKKPAKKLQE